MWPHGRIPSSFPNTLGKRNVPRRRQHMDRVDRKAHTRSVATRLDGGAQGIGSIHFRHAGNSNAVVAPLESMVSADGVGRKLLEHRPGKTPRFGDVDVHDLSQIRNSVATRSRRPCVRDQKQIEGKHLDVPEVPCGSASHPDRA